MSIFFVCTCTWYVYPHFDRVIILDTSFVLCVKSYSNLFFFFFFFYLVSVYRSILGFVTRLFSRVFSRLRQVVALRAGMLRFYLKLLSENRNNSDVFHQQIAVNRII